MAAYSVQQIKFEFISYVKEFGADFSAWSVGVSEDAPAALFHEHGIDEARDIWLWKPAVSPAAAAMVRDWLCGRQGAAALAGEGRQVFLFRRGPEKRCPGHGVGVRSCRRTGLPPAAKRGSVRCRGQSIVTGAS